MNDPQVNNKNLSNSINSTAKIQQTSLDYCVNLVKSRDYEGYLCALLLPRAVREVAFAVRAFNVELSNIREQITCHSGAAGVFRLQFWKDTVDTLYGDKSDVLPRQPVAAVLQQIVAPPGGQISKLWLQNMVEARQATLEEKPFDSKQKFEEYALKTHGSVLFATLEAMGVFREDIYPSDTIEERETVEKIYHIAESLAKATAYMSLIKSIGPLAAGEIVLIPADLMKTYSIKQEDVIRAKDSEMMNQLFWHLGDLCRIQLSAAKLWTNRIPREIRPAFLGAVIVDRFLLRFSKLFADVYDADLHKRDPFLPVRMGMLKLLRSY